MVNRYFGSDLIARDIPWCTSVKEYVVKLCVGFNLKVIESDPQFKKISFRRGMSSALFDIEQIMQDQAGL